MPTSNRASVQALDAAVQAAAAGEQNRYEHGFRKLHLAPITTDGSDTAKPVYAKPVTVSGEVKLSLSDGSSADDIYAGDEVYDSVAVKAVLSGTLEIYGDLPAELEQSIMGHTKDANGAIGLKDGGKRAPFAVLYQSQGSEEPVDLVLYKVKVTKENDIAPETDGETPVVNTHVYNIACFYQNFAGEAWNFTRVKKSQSPAAFDKFFDGVYDPTAKVES